MYHGFIISLLFLYMEADITYQWNPPSFTSQWYPVEAMVTGDLTISHGLNEMPIKVDVQIKIVKNNEDYVFTGTGTAQRDNDDSPDYGGIVYVYNEVHVILYTPYVGMHGGTSGSIAYTGSSTDYKGPSSVRGSYTSGQARVRVWKASDFPTPLFTLSISISDSGGDCFKEQSHGSSEQPDLVIAQVYIENGYVSEAQGNIFQETTINSFNTMVGVVFGYDSEKVKMWVPNGDGQSHDFNGGVYGHYDGWGTTDYFTNSGNVVLKGYKPDIAFQTSFEAGRGIVSSDTINFGKIYNLDTSLVNVQVKQDEDGQGSNGEMIFNGAGSAMPTGRIYSGVVYVYTNNSALLYTPSDTNTNGYMIYLGNRWGNNQHPSSETSAEVIVTVFSDIATCPDPNVVNTSHTLTNGLEPGSVVQYICDYGYVYSSGYLTRTCTSSGNWDGIAPVCTQKSCNDPGSVYNSSYSLTGLLPGDTATYTCITGSQTQAGDTVRTCQSDGTWSGTPIVCVNMPSCQPHGCHDPGAVSNATYNLTALTIGSTATYVCDTGYSYEAGNLIRICQSSGTWNGIPPVCSEERCYDPGSVYNSSYSLTGLQPGDTATYSCIPGSQKQGGDTVRTCQSDGTWSGTPIVCVNMPTCQTHGCHDPGAVSNATYNLTALTIGSTATYVCDTGYSYEAGNLIRICQSSGTWNGIPPVCSEERCYDPGSVYNSSYSLTGLQPGDTATYSCIPGSQKQGGDTVRTCQSDGTWSGTPIVCVNMPTCQTSITSVPVVYSPESLAESIEKTKKELTVDKKETNAYQRSLTSARDFRPSATYIGTGGVLLLCSLLVALVIPDLFTFFRHIQHYTVIFNSSSKEN